MRHNMSHSSEYGIWRGILARCNNPKCKAYKNYGARGITFPDSWNTFEGFIADVGLRPEGMSLDREDNDLGYSKGNCRWATAKEQHNNTRSNLWLTYQGETLTAAQWGDKLNTPRHRIYKRLQYGWSIERTLTEPHRDQKK